MAALILTRFWFGKSDLSMALNGVLAGLVAITAEPLTPTPGLATFIGLIAGLIVVVSIILVDRWANIDDPVGAISVHGIVGIWGLLAVVMSNPDASFMAQVKSILLIFNWFFGKGEPPRFDRWAYWEKFDYWAVYWGAFVIGLSGLILWFSPFFSQYFPGWVFNLSTLAHGLEAFLAVMTLFVVHFFNNHFRPSKFPLDTVMFTGSWDLEEFKEERPEEYKRLKASGELEKRLVDPPTRRVKTVSYILGFTLLGIGLVLLTLVIIGFIQNGLV